MWVTLTLVALAVLTAVVVALSAALASSRKLDDALGALGTCLKVD